MKISLNWLQDYIDLKVTNPQIISDVLTERVAEVDKVIDEKEQFKGIVIGKILKISPHPDADKIRITETEIAPGEVRQIVCGAPNIQEGDIVPVATVGTKIQDFVIEKRKIRGVASEGMLCSKKELGLGDDHSGIYILPNNLTIGADFASSIGLDDIILEIDNTAITNRPDLFSHYGFAREFVATHLGEWKKNMQNHIENMEKMAENNPSKELSFDLNITDPELCPRWCGLEMEKVEIAKSPDWIKQRLQAVGIRPINNIVDATNYVMLEFGMPMHAFDRDKLQGNQLIMREAKKGETMTTLDEKIHELPEKAIIMEDQKTIFDLCGLMGGLSSAISDETTNLLIHAPVYEPIRIRRTAIKLDHRTDAATIYEKGVPPSIAMAGLMRTAQLILLTSPDAEITTKAKDINNSTTTKKIITLEKALIDKVLGVNIESQEVERILKALGCEPQIQQSDNLWNVIIPSHRQRDINIKEDLVEEICRIYGFNNIAPAPPSIIMQDMNDNPEKSLINRISDILIANNFYEIVTLAFYGPDLFKRADWLTDNNLQHLEVVNPLSREQSLMRTSLFPRLLETGEKNARYQDNFRIFEIGKTFELIDQEKNEAYALSALLVGNDFYFAKGIVENLFNDLGEQIDFIQSSKSPQSAEITYLGQSIGLIADLNKKLKTEFDFSATNCSVINLNLQVLMNLKTKIQKYKPLPKYPSINYDVSILAPRDIACSEIIKIVHNLDPLIVNTSILEIYTGKEVEENKKSITLAFEFRATDRTLEEGDAKKLEQKIAHILQKHHLELRF